MTEATHTPGPWPDWFGFDPATDVVTLFGIRYHADLLSAFGVQPAGYTFKIVERHDGVITISQERNDLEAAAPVMLEALRGTLKVIDTLSAISVPESQKAFAMWRGEVVAAIEQATGATPHHELPRLRLRRDRACPGNHRQHWSDREAP